MTDTSRASSADAADDDLTYGCSCGAVRGRAHGLSPKTMRGVCMCRDCRAFLVHLGREEVLDAHGGTDIFQCAPAWITIEQGADQLSCLRLSAKGMYRWYAGCCNTPLGNSMGPAAVPFVGVPAVALGPAERLEELGPPRARVFAVDAPDPSKAPGHRKLPLSIIAQTVGFLARGWLKRAHKPSPFRRADGSWIAEPHVLTDAERANAYR